MSEVSYAIGSVKGKMVGSELVKLSLNINLDLIRPGSIMKIDLDNESIVGQVYTVSPRELTLFFIDSDSMPEVREFTVDQFTSGKCVPYIVTF